MKALIISYGAAGRRHAGILYKLGFQIHVVTSQNNLPAGYTRFKDLTSALGSFHYDYIVVASITSDHHSDLKKILENHQSSTILVEKPLFSIIPNGLSFPTCNNIYVGYNLRFMSHMRTLLGMLKGQTILRATFVCSSYLPHWRTGQSYHCSYSSSKEKGGGVLRDLSHEIDLVCLFLGNPKRILCKIGHMSDLTGNSDDSCDLIFSTDKCKSVVITLNCLSRIKKRFFIIDTTENSYYYDIMNDSFVVNGNEPIIGNGLDHSYVKMHEEIINRRSDLVCDFQQGMNVMKVIEQAEYVGVSYDE